MDPIAAKYIGAGIACIGMGGAGVGVGIIFGNYLAAAIRNPSAAQGQFGNLIFGFAITEALGIFSLGVPFGILVGFMAGGWLDQELGWRQAFIVVGLPGVVLAISLALLHVLVRIYRPADALLGIVPGMDGYNELDMSPNARTVPGAILYRFEAPLLFFNADYFKARVLSLVANTQPRPRWFVLSAEAISQLDTTGAQAVDELYAELQTRGVQLMVARHKLYMRRYGLPIKLGEKIGLDNIFPSIRQAVEAIRQREAGRVDQDHSSE